MKTSIAAGSGNAGGMWFYHHTFCLVKRFASPFAPRKLNRSAKRFFLGVPTRADHGAEVWLYTVQN
jgi:hypothetical protein